MEGTILLNSNDNTKQVEEEEKSRFVKSILEIMGVPISEIWSSDQELSVEEKIQLRSLLSTYNIKVIDDSDGQLQIYVDGELIGRWDKPSYILKRDLSELDPNNQLYLELTYKYWSIFDQED